MAPLDTPPAGVDLAASKRPLLIAICSTSWALAIIVTCLRVLCRRLMKLRLWLDDWLIIASLVCTTATAFFIMFHKGTDTLGRHVWAESPRGPKVFAQREFFGALGFILSTVLIKSSLLAFFWRIFAIEESIKLRIWIVAGIVCSWGIACILVVIFQCLPINAVWDRFDLINPMPASAYSCSINMYKFYLGAAVANTIADILILLLPLPYIWKLSLSLPQRVAIISIFLCGSFVTVISGVRILFLVNFNLSSPDVTWNAVDSAIWTELEAHIGTICASLPTLKPLLNLLLFGRTTVEPKPHIPPTPVLRSWHEDQELCRDSATGSFT